MLCMICKKHATWRTAVFQDASPTQVRLCADCARERDADGHMERIHGAGDHTEKNAAVADFLHALGR